jgi:stearoyl-CoA desaturase (delta-9 desaturase)
MLNTLLDFAARGLTGAGWITWLIYGLIVTQLTVMAVTLYLHRSQTHRGVDFHPVVAHFLRFWSWLTTGIVTKEWVAVHRKHHARVETAEDPHSPQVYGIQRVLWDGTALYRKAAANREDLQKYGRGTPDDWIERHLYSKHGYWGPLLMLLIDVALFGVVGVAIWAIQMAWIPFWGAGVLNGLCHWAGYRNFQTTDTSANITPWAFWLGGEELHNNHHAFPSSAKFALRRWEFDIGWATICALAKLRLATVLRVAPKLDVRPNVSLPDTETLKAVLTHRFQAMTDYYRHVIMPTLREDAAHSGQSDKSIVPARLRRALADGGRWLDNDGRERLQATLEKRPALRTVCSYRARLMALMEQRGSERALSGLQQWVRDAEDSGIRVLQDFAARLKTYRVATHHA